MCAGTITQYRCHHEHANEYIEEMQKHYILKLSSAYGHGKRILNLQRQILLLIYPVYCNCDVVE